MLAKIRWRIKFYYRKWFVHDGVFRTNPDDISDVAYAPAQKLYFDGTENGVWTEEELVGRINYKPS